MVGSNSSKLEKFADILVSVAIALLFLVVLATLLSACGCTLLGFKGSAPALGPAGAPGGGNFLAQPPAPLGVDWSDYKQVAGYGAVAIGTVSLPVLMSTIAGHWLNKRDRRRFHDPSV